MALVVVVGSVSIGAALWRLLKLHVFLLGHEPSQFLEDSFDRVVSRPPAQKGDIARLNL